MTFLIPVVHQVPPVDIPIPFGESVCSGCIIDVAEEEAVRWICVIAISQGHEREADTPVGSYLISGFILGNIVVLPESQIVVKVQLGARAAYGIGAPFYGRGIQFRMPQFCTEIELTETYPG